jgi:hypothetical protein
MTGLDGFLTRTISTNVRSRKLIKNLNPSKSFVPCNPTEAKIDLASKTYTSSKSPYDTLRTV